MREQHPGVLAYREEITTIQSDTNFWLSEILR
jgi:hypothetical protein